MHNRTLFALLTLACLPAAAQPQLTTVATGLNNPRGLTFGPGGRLYVAEAGLGAGNGSGGAAEGVGYTGSISEIQGVQSGHPTLRRIVTGLPSSAFDPEDVVGPDGISALGNGDIFAIMAFSASGIGSEHPGEFISPALAAQFGQLLKISQSGNWKKDADVGDFSYAWTSQHQNDPWAPEGQFPDANPYAVLALPGREYVIDAGANTLNEVRPDGSVRIIAFFPNPQLPAVPGGPPAITISDAVPTCVGLGPDGRLYVGTLAFGANFARFDSTAPPFWATLPPQSKIYRVDPNRTNIFLTEADVWAAGLNPITGCGFAPGGFYATEFITQASGYNTGDVVRIAMNSDGSAGARSELGAGALVLPNGFAAGPDGSIYVSNFSVFPGIPQNPGDPVGEVVRVNH
jgi:hypothetical protein